MNKINKFLLFSFLLISSLIKSEVKDIQTVAEFNSYLNQGPLVVDFHGESFCAPCQRMVKPFKKLSEKFTQVKFAKVDAQQIQELSTQYNIGGLPTFITFKDGKEVNRIVGGRQAELEAAIKKISENAQPARSVQPTEESEKPAAEPKPKVSSETSAPSLSGGALVNFNSKEEFDSTVKSGKSVVVELEKTTCEFCKFMKKPMETLAAKYSDVLFTIINKDEAPDFEEEYADKVKGYPTFLVFKDGNLVLNFTGATGDEDKNLGILDGRIRSALGKAGKSEYVVKSKSEVEGKEVSKKGSYRPTARKQQARAKAQYGSRMKERRSTKEAMPRCEVGV